MRSRRSIAWLMVDALSLSRLVGVVFVDYRNRNANPGSFTRYFVKESE